MLPLLGELNFLIQPDIRPELRFLPTTPAFDAPLGRWGGGSRRNGKTRMVWLPDGEKISKICLFVLT